MNNSDIIKTLGGAHLLAQHFGLTDAAVQGWARRGIPTMALRYLSLKASANKEVADYCHQEIARREKEKIATAVSLETFLM